MAADNISKFYGAFNKKYNDFNTEDEFRDWLGKASREDVDKLYGLFNKKYDNFGSSDEMISYLGWADPASVEEPAKELTRREKRQERREERQQRRQQRQDRAEQADTLLNTPAAVPPATTPEVAETISKDYNSLMTGSADMDKAVKDFNKKWRFLDEQTKAMQSGKLQLNTQDSIDLYNSRVAQYNKEAEALKKTQAALAKNRDAILNSPEGQEYKRLFDQIDSLSKAEQTPENTWALAQAQAQMLRNPVARATMGDKAPSDAVVDYTLNRGEADYINALLKEGVDRQTKKKLKERLKELSAEVLDNEYYQSDVAKRLGETDKELEEKLQRIAELSPKAFVVTNPVAKAPILLELESLTLSVNELRNQKRKLEHIRDKNAGDFWVNFMDVLSDSNTYNFGITNLETFLATLGAKKYENAPGAKELLDAVAGSNATEAEESEFVTGKGRWGAIAANSIPFMASIAATGGFGNVAKAVGAGTGKLASRIARKEIANNLLVKATGAVLGDLAAGFVSANTIGGAKTLTDFLNSYYGTLQKDENGNYNYEGGTGNVLKSGWKSEVGNVMEYASERAGDHLQHILGKGILGAEIKAVRSGRKAAISPWKEALAKGMDVTLKDFGFRGSNALDMNAATKAFSKFIDISNKVGIQGYPFEAIEEYVGLLGNILLGGEEDWMDFSKLGDKDTHSDIWGGMLYSIGLTQSFGVAAGAAGTAIAGAQKAKTYKELESYLNDASQYALNVMDEQTWGAIKEKIDASTNPELTKFISETMDSSDYSDEEKAAILDYAKGTFVYRGFNAGTIAQARERLTSDDNLQSLNINAEVATASEQIADAYMLGYTSGEQSDDNKSRVELEKAVERQKERLSAVTGIQDMTEEQANALLEDETASQEVKDAALDYLMAIGVEQGFADAERNKQTKIKADMFRSFERDLGGKFYYTDEATGERVVQLSYMTGSDGRDVPVFLLSDTPDSKGLVPYRDTNGKFGMVSRDNIHGEDGTVGATEKMSLNQFMDGQYQLYEERRAARDAQEDQAVADAENAQLLGTMVGQTVFVSGNGAYEPMTIERTTNNGQSVVISGDKEALKGVAAAAGIPFPGGSMLEIPTNALYPLLAKNDDGSISTQAAAAPQGADTEGVGLMLDGRPLGNVQIDEEAGSATFNYADDPNGVLHEMDLDEFRQRTGVGAPAAAQEEAPAAPIAQENISTRPYFQLFENSDKDTDGDIVIVRDQLDAKRRRLQIKQWATSAKDDAEFLARVQGAGLKFAFKDVASGAIKKAFDDYKSGTISEEQFLDMFTPKEFRASSQQPIVPETQEAQSALPMKNGEVDWDNMFNVPAEEFAKRLPELVELMTSLYGDKAADYAMSWYSAEKKKLDGIKEMTGDPKKDAQNAKKRAESQVLVDNYSALTQALQASKEAAAAPAPAAAQEAQAEGDVPDMSDDTPEAAQQRGYIIQNGNRIDRSPEDAIVHEGADTKIAFTKSEAVDGKYGLVEAGRIVPSHISDQENPLHFFAKNWQPKDRKKADSASAIQQMANSIRPGEITRGETAYGGAPVVNARGEVIQGNGRGEALRRAYQQGTAAQYKEWLADHAEEFGFTREQVEGMQNPVLVRALNVDDARAEELGKREQKDLESGGDQTFNGTTLAKKIGDRLGEFADILFAGDLGDDATLNDYINTNGDVALKWLRRNGFINDTEYQNALVKDKSGGFKFTDATVAAFRELSLEPLFAGASEKVRQGYEKSPNIVKLALQRSVAMLSQLDGVLPDIQDALAYFYDFETADPAFRSAKDEASAKKAMLDWMNNLLLENGKSEAEMHPNLAARYMAAWFKGAKNIKSLTDRFRFIAETMRGEGGFMTAAEPVDRVGAYQQAGLISEEEANQIRNGRNDAEVQDVPEGGADTGTGGRQGSAGVDSVGGGNGTGSEEDSGAAPEGTGSGEVAGEAQAEEVESADPLLENETQEIRDAVDAIVSGKDTKKREVTGRTPDDFTIGGKDINSYIRDRYDRFKAPLEKRREELRKELVAYRDRIESEARADIMRKNPHIKEDNPYLPDYVSEEADKRLKNDERYNSLDSQIKAIDDEIGNYQTRRYNAFGAIDEIFARSQEVAETSEQTAEEGAQEEIDPELETPKGKEPELLTEEQIRNSGYEDPSVIEQAVDYINGNTGNILNQVAYQTIEEYVRRLSGNSEQAGGTAGGAQLGAAAPSNQGRGESGTSGGELESVDTGDRTQGVSGTTGGVQSGGEGASAQSPSTPGEGGNTGVSEQGTSGLGGVSSRGGGRGRRGASGKRGHELHNDGQGDGSSSRPDDQNPGGDNQARIEQLDSEIDDLLGQLKDTLSGFSSPDGTLSVAIVPGFTPAQLQKLAQAAKITAQIGFKLIQKGYYTLADYIAQLGAAIKAVLKKAGISDDEIDRFIRDSWDSFFSYNGETHRLCEWATILQDEAFRKMAELSLEEKRKLQKEANKRATDVKVGDILNVREQLPFLFQHQHDNVVKAENQFFGEDALKSHERAYGKGMMFTDGTGTGKTYTGLGIIKRFINQGKGRILLVCPAGKVVDWQKDAANLGLSPEALKTSGKGSGFVVMSYESFRKNKDIMEDTFDLVVYDEAHKMMSSVQAAETQALNSHFFITNRDEDMALRRLQSTNELWKKEQDLKQTIEYQEGRLMEGEADAQAIIDKSNGELKKIQELQDKALPKLEEEAKDAVKKTKVLFLTATPFNSERNMFYADRYIFNSQGTAEQVKNRAEKNEGQFSSSEGDFAYWLEKTFPAKFYVSGSDAKEKHGNAVKIDEQEMNWNEWAKDAGVLSGQKINIPYDYSRDFPQVSIEHQVDFNAALEDLRRNPRYTALQPFFPHLVGKSGEGDYNWTSYLWEVMKASGLKPRIDEHLAMGRKVVIFNRRRYRPGEKVSRAELKRQGRSDEEIEEILAASEANRGLPPMGPPFAAGLDMAIASPDSRTLMAAHAFAAEYRSLLAWEQTLDYRPIEEQFMDMYATDQDRERYNEEHKKWEKAVAEIRQENLKLAADKQKPFPPEPRLKASGIGLVRGTGEGVTDKSKLRDQATFNNTDKMNIIIVQEASGKEGISLHDTTGEHQRVLISTALPQSPLTFIQIEGRIYRLGNKSNAIYEYPVLGINLEVQQFAGRISSASQTTENLAMGYDARGLRESIKNGILNRAGIVPLDGQGHGGKEFDQRASMDAMVKGFDGAIETYNSALPSLSEEEKNNPDMAITPHPLGYKMSQWSRVSEGETFLEPGAGRGILAQYVPKSNSMTALETEGNLFTKLSVTLAAANRTLHQKSIREYSVINKHDVILMHPSVGENGVEALEQFIEAAQHLDEGGRIIAVIPQSLSLDSNTINEENNKIRLANGEEYTWDEFKEEYKSPLEGAGGFVMAYVSAYVGGKSSKSTLLEKLRSQYDIYESNMSTEDEGSERYEALRLKRAAVAQLIGLLDRDGVSILTPGSDSGAYGLLKTDAYKSDFTKVMKGLVKVGEVKLPDFAIGGNVPMQVVVYDQVSRKETRKKVPAAVSYDVSDAKDMPDFFEKIRNLDMPERTVDNMVSVEKAAKRFISNISDNKDLFTNDGKNNKVSDGVVWLDFKTVRDWHRDLFGRFSSGPNGYRLSDLFPFAAQDAQPGTPKLSPNMAKWYLRIADRLNRSDDEYASIISRSGNPHPKAGAIRQYEEALLKFFRDASGLTETQIRRVADGLPAEVSEADLEGDLTFDKLKGKFDIANGNDDFRLKMFNKVLDKGVKSGLSLKHYTGYGNDVGLYRSGEHSLEINERSWNRLPNATRATVICHEALHSATTLPLELNKRLDEYDFISNDQFIAANEILNPKAKEACEKLENIYKAITKGEESYKVQGYGLSNSHEMIAELANPEYRDALKSRSLWKLPNGSFSGFEVPGAEKTNALDEVVSAVNQLIDSFNAEDYIRARDIITNRGGFASVFRDVESRLADDTDGNDEIEGMLFRDGEGEVVDQTETPAFKNWFGDWENDPANASKVVNEDGTPRVVYHGTKMPFWAFDGGKTRGMFTDGLNYFALDREFSEDWARRDDEKRRTPEVNQRLEAAQKKRREHEREIAQGIIKKYEGQDIKYYDTPEYNEWIEDKEGRDKWERENLGLDGMTYREALYELGKRILPVYINSRNPYNPTERYESEGKQMLIDLGLLEPNPSPMSEMYARGGAYLYYENKKVVDELKKRGYDSIYLTENVSSDPSKNLRTIAVWDSNRIKSATDNNGEFDTANDDIRFREETDADVLERLDSEPTIPAYRAMQFVPDPNGDWEFDLGDGKGLQRGFLYPPMSAKVDGKWRNPVKRDKWERSVEDPSRVSEEGPHKNQFYLDRGDEGGVWAAYNPYFHSSDSMLNDQFKKAQSRDNLVVVEVMVPEREVADNNMNPYRAEKAKNAVGKHEWKAGAVQSQLTGTRNVYLSRWDKPTRIVPVDEVARNVERQIRGQVKEMPSNVVWPQLRAELEKLGVNFVETDNKGNFTEGARKGQSYESVYGAKNRLSKQEQKELEKQRKKEREERADAHRRIVEAEYLATTKALDTMSELLGITINRVGREGMPAGHKTAKGYYNPRTGQMTICMENVTDERDAIATVFHETVAHHGLRKLFGPYFNEAMVNIYAALDARGRAWVHNYIQSHNLQPGDEGIIIGMEEYMAHLAESGNFKKTAWEKIKEIFGRIVDKLLGIQGFTFTDNELNYILRASYENLTNPGWIDTVQGKAVNTLMKRALGINETDPKLPTDPESYDAGLRYRDGDTGVARADYEAAMQQKRTAIIMQNQNADLPVKIGMEKAVQEWEKKHPKQKFTNHEDEDYLTRHNLASSRAETEAHNFELFRFTPLLDQVRAIQDRLVGDRATRQDREGAYQRILDYMYAVSGLERTRYKNNEIEQAKQDALKGVTDPAIRAEIEQRFEDMKKDWAGLTSLMGLDPSEWRQAEVEAENMIDTFRNAVGDDAALDELWNRVRACTDYSLEHAYKYGLLTREEYERLHGTASQPRMWDYYLPLRGFAEDTAEDLFSYNNFTNPSTGDVVVKKMNGRWTQADNPLANILNIAETEIVQGNDNWAKQALLKFTRHLGGNSLLTEAQPWYEKNADTGKWMLAEPEPNETLEAFEARMNALRSLTTPLAKKGRQGLKLDNIMANKAHRNEHLIRLKVDGMDKMIWVNGNPALAQAVSGIGRAQNLQWFRRASRALSNLFTTYSLDFTAKNLIRDTIYSRVALMVKEDKAYRHQFSKNWLANFGYGAFAFPMVKLAADWNSGKLQAKDPADRTKREQMFIDFMTDGGQTGYTIINSVGAIKRDLERQMRRAGGKPGTVPVLGWYAKAVKTLNEAFELLTRFTAYETSRDMGRSGQRSASDAKEISVNFNRRGAQSGGDIWGNIAAYLGATHYFYNAGVQGFDNFLHLFKKSPVKMSVATGGLVLMGVLTPLINGLLAGLFGGDDDDNEDWYWNLPEWVRRNNLILGTGEWYLAIPMPVEFRAPYGIGDIIGAAFCYEKYANRRGGIVPWGDLSFDIISTASGILPVNPVEGYTGNGNIGDAAIRAVVPDATMFFVDWATNRDYTGRPLWKENPFSDTTPKSQGAYASTPKGIVAACQKLAEVTAGGIDVAPGLVRDFLNNYGGGFYRAAEDASKIFTGIFGDDPERPLRWDNVPFFSGFTGHIDEDRSNSFASNALYDYKKVSEGVVKDLNSVLNTSDVTTSIAYDTPEALYDMATSVVQKGRVKKILDSKDYELGKMYREGMNNSKDEIVGYKTSVDKNGRTRTTPIKKLGVDSLKKKWKDLREEWAKMPSKTQEEKDAKEEFSLQVQDAWHLYYDAEADLAQKLLDYEYGKN